jgi:hypothetical protein
MELVRRARRTFFAYHIGIFDPEYSAIPQKSHQNAPNFLPLNES